MDSKNIDTHVPTMYITCSYLFKICYIVIICTLTTEYVHETYSCIPGMYLSTFVCRKFNHSDMKGEKEEVEAS